MSSLKWYSDCLKFKLNASLIKSNSEMALKNTQIPCIPNSNCGSMFRIFNFFFFLSVTVIL